jgi:methylated-DNA-protein-cysteine methyltransferase-like protein
VTDNLSFSQRVYQAVSRIPPGKVCSYGQIALMVGSPGAARQVGWALANLSVENTDVPWHRVINARGGISIRGRGDCADLQRLMLEKEGVFFDDRGYTNMERYRYTPE